MTIAAAAGLQFPTAPVVRTNNPRSADTATVKRPEDSEQFAALMSLLANTNPQLRNSLMKQVPANGAGLLDQLLSGAQTGELNESLANALTGALAGPESNNSTNSALDAARYGLLTESTLPTASTKSERGNQSRISSAVLSRIASRKSSSVDELLAVGDREGALARAKLDALLATAGTTEGATLAAANALAAQLVQSANNPSTPITSTDGLDPEFKSRLDRVLSRMKNETGLDVTLVETVRSQERQNALYAQGRTTSGDVVTWTQDSLHTRGKAADVMVGGSYNNPQGFQLLQKIALEEGLNTLGPSDPGHLEMPKDSQAIDAATRALAAANARVVNSSSNGVARVASVSTVAQVASIGNNSAIASDSTNKVNPTPAASNNATTAAPTWSASSQKSSTSDSESSGSTGDKSTSAARNSKSSRTNDNGASAFDASRNGDARFIGPKDTTETPPAQPVDGAQRVQDIDTLRDQAATKSLSQITLEIDGENGQAQQITVDMRGKVVGTHITTDEASAQRLRPHIGELQSALQNRGLETDVVRISSNARTTELGDQAKQMSAGERDAIRLGGAANTPNGEGATQQQRERSPAARDWDDRQAARDEQRRNAKQQDQQRPQYQEKQ